MEKTTDIIALRQPKPVEDPLNEVARNGARRMLASALRAGMFRCKWCDQDCNG